MFRYEEKKSYRTVVICDRCGKEEVVLENTPFIPSFDTRMNLTIGKGYSLVQKFGAFYYYCKECAKHEVL
jgi:hypothetical protein